MTGGRLLALFRGVALPVGGALASAVAAASGQDGPGSYQQVEEGGGTFHVYRVAPSALTLHWQGGDGKPMRTFPALERHLASRGRRPVFLMNAGIFEPGGIPSGLHVERGVELRPLNRESGRGNFYLKPNGVFCVTATDGSGGEEARVLTADAYAAAGLEPRFALQSGPMLLVEGRPHPAFRPASDSRLHRNGVGVLPDGDVLFIMTDLASGTRVNLYTFAMMFRQRGCRDALFLDGDLSMMAVGRGGGLALADSRPGKPRELAPGVAAGNHFGAILAVTVLPGDGGKEAGQAAGEGAGQAGVPSR